MTAEPAADKAETVAAIVDFHRLTDDQCKEAADILRAALAYLPSGYDKAGHAEAEVALCRTDNDWRGFVSLEGDRVVGWIGAITTYVHGWEIHPLVVGPEHQRRGIGSALLAQLENRARADGVLTLFLGSDDDNRGTTLFGRDLFPDVLAHASTAEPTRRGHALAFYRRHGYQIVGLLPNANGVGRHDILMAKRISSSRSSSSGT
jgi:aminoglycoside 6'-N-acetyltransferase I